jgi:transcriptional regulator with XRE-family HTH domain
VNDRKTLVTELNRIRLEENLSYAEIAADMELDPGALYKILNELTDKPYDRTLYKIRRYLAEREAPPARRKAASAR